MGFCFRPSASRASRASPGCPGPAAIARGAGLFQARSSGLSEARLTVSSAWAARFESR